MGADASGDGRLTVVVCSHDRPQQTAAAIISLQAMRSTAPVELLVVDSCSKGDEVVATAARLGVPCVRSFRFGLSCAKNVGLDAVDTELVAFPGDAAVFDPRWAEEAIAGFADPAVGFVSGRVVPVPARADALSAWDRRVDRRFAVDHDDPFGCGNGANMCFRTAALRSVGGFDECLGSGGPLRTAEDVDVVFRLFRAGWEGVFRSAAVVQQPQWRTGWRAAVRRVEYGIGGGAVAAKAVRLGDERAWGLLGKRLWRYGFGSCLRQEEWAGQPFHAAACQAVGSLAGFAAGMVRPMAGDIFVRRFRRVSDRRTRHARDRG